MQYKFTISFLFLWLFVITLKSRYDKPVKYSELSIYRHTLYWPYDGAYARGWENEYRIWIFILFADQKKTR